MQTIIKKTTKNAEKTKERFDVIRNTLAIFERFYALGFRQKNKVFIQLILRFPNYNNVEGEKKFTALWSFKTFNNTLIKDLERTIINLENRLS